MKAKFEPAYGPMVEVCGNHGISRTVSFELARTGLLDTFTIGKRRYVFLESVRKLPERLAAVEAGEVGGINASLAKRGTSRAAIAEKTAAELCASVAAILGREANALASTKAKTATEHESAATKAP